MDAAPQLRTVGIVAGDRAPAERVAAYQLRLSQAATLGDLTEEFVFYTPGIFYLVTGEVLDPMQHFCLEQNEAIHPLSVSFDKPLFKNLNVGLDTRWSHVLYALPRQHWEAFRQFMGTVAFTDRASGRFYRCRTQQIWINDPLVLLQSVVLPDRCPQVEITAFVVDSNQGSWYFQPQLLDRARVNPLLDLPEVVYDSRVHLDTATFAQAIHRGVDRPYEAVDRLRDGN